MKPRKQIDSAHHLWPQLQRQFMLGGALSFACYHPLLIHSFNKEIVLGWF